MVKSKSNSNAEKSATKALSRPNIGDKNKNQDNKNSTVKKSDSTTPNRKSEGGMSKLQSQFAKKLEGARFRSINEDLYTAPGDRSFEDFQKDPTKFHAYHQGYREQVLSWPYNPLDRIISWIKEKFPKAVVADMGCGEAKLAESVGNKVHSFDLVAANERVTPCNIACVPLPDESVDIVVFCLSLMGTNFVDFLKEAHRILKMNGIIKIVEVRSRLEDAKGIRKFTKFIKRMGFLVKPPQEMSDNKMFFEVECCKATRKLQSVEGGLEMKPCQYKKR